MLEPAALLPLLLALSQEKATPAPSPAVPPLARSLPVRPTAPQADDSLPASEKRAKSVLESSPRHGEFVDVKRDGGAAIKTWVVYPERKDKAPVVVLIHEIFGLSDWMRAVADQLANEGFIAVAPDLLSGMGPNGGGTDSFGSRDDVVKMVRNLSPEETQARLDAVRAYAAKIPSADGKTATMGFCWGGAASFLYAARRPDLKAAVVYYGVAPAAEDLAKLEVPVLGLYGGDDARVTSTIEPAKVELQKRGRNYQAMVYDGAGHGFLRAQEDRDGKNLEATRKAWPKTLQYLREKMK